MVVLPLHRPLRRLLFSSFNLLMNSKHFLKPFPSCLSRTTHRLVFSTSLSEPTFSSKLPSLCLTSSRRCHTSHAHVLPQAYTVKPEVNTLALCRLDFLKQKMEVLGIDISVCKFGENTRLICPRCKGGDSAERSFSLFITKDGNSATWTCFRGKCGWKGGMQAVADPKSSYGKMKQTTKVQNTRKITVDSLCLEPLSDEVV